MSIIGLKPYLHVRTVKNPVYSQDGSTLNFLTDYTGFPQVWECQKGTGWPTQVTFTDERIIFVEYINGGDKRIVGMDIGVNEKQQLFLLEDTGELISLTNSLEHIHRYGGSSPDGNWIAWASNRRNSMYFDIYIQNIHTKEIKQVFSDNGTYGVLKWHPNGQDLLIQRTNSNLDNDLGILHLETSEVNWLTPHVDEAQFIHPHFNFDGSILYLLTNKGREFTGLAALEIATGNITWVYCPNWDIEDLVMSHNKKLLAYTINEGGVSKGVVRDLKSNQQHTWKSPVGVITEPTFSADDKKLAYIFNGPCHPSDIWELDIQSNEACQITFASRSPIVERRLVEPELIHFSSFDGLNIPAFYYKPKEKEENLPVVIFVHGGPESQIRAVYNPFLQYFVNRGYAVCTPNVRGSSGYGKPYVHLDDVRKRMNSAKDLTYLVKWLKEKGHADAKKIAIMGRSYGGFMVLAAVTHYPDLWAAGIDIVGISSFKSFLKNTSPWRRKLREVEYGSLENDLDFFDQIDPIHRTKDIICPLMVLHGANDPRVPIEETEQIVHELEARNHPITYIRFDDEGHFFVKLQNNITAYSGVADFLDQYLK